MKKNTFFISFLFIIGMSYSQNVLLNFSGSGSSSTVDSVRVYNLTQGISQLFNGSDTLELVVSTSVYAHTWNNSSVTVFPNPSQEKIFVQLISEKEDDVLCCLYGLDGRRIIERSIKMSSGANMFELSGLSTGIYFINFSTKESYFTEKIIITGTSQNRPEIKFEGIDVLKEDISYFKNTEKSTIQMPYNQGDMLLLEGFSGNYTYIKTLIPSTNTTVDFSFISCTDGAGNHYPVVTIGTQIWMGSNLRTTLYNNGTNIPTETDNITWGNLTSAAYCWHSNDSVVNGKTYGALYNFEAVNSGILCPMGWHVPTQAEWDTLINGLGGLAFAGGKLRETGTQHWTAPNTGATNESGFTALPGSSRYGSLNNGAFSTTLGTQALWWSATEITGTNAWYYETQNTHGGASSGSISKQYGMSVRCIKN